MVAYQKSRSITPEEYLSRERVAETKSEYENGVLIGMAGATNEHNRIAVDALVSLANQLRSKPCEPFGSDMRVRVSARKYYYPDITVVCGQPQFDGTDTLTNPTLVVEVISDSSERRDRIVKFDAYRALPSLSVYVLVEQDQPRIECFSRQPDGFWRYDVAVGLDSVLSLPALGCSLRLEEVYARVTFPPAEKEDENVE